MMESQSNFKKQCMHSFFPLMKKGEERFITLFEDISESSVFSYKLPMLIGIILVYLAVIFLQEPIERTKESVSGFTIVLLIFAVFFWRREKIFKRHNRLYFAIQGLIVFDCAVIMPSGYETIYLSLLPMLMFQSITVYESKLEKLLTSTLYYIIFCITMITTEGWQGLIHYLPLFFLITVVLQIYSALYIKQVSLRIQYQKNAKELELSKDKIAELTLSNERQRMARDLHDTLSQGLVGIVMKLEAVQSLLETERTDRAKIVISDIQLNARKTLAESRQVIDDLRQISQKYINCEEELNKEIILFTTKNPIPIVFDFKVETKLSMAATKHLIYILREALNNITKHAKASHVRVSLIEVESKLVFDIKDDGIGFDIAYHAKIPGHYGLIGLEERVKALEGTIAITSKKRSGTHIHIELYSDQVKGD